MPACFDPLDRGVTAAPTGSERRLTKRRAIVLATGRPADLALDSGIEAVGALTRPRPSGRTWRQLRSLAAPGGSCWRCWGGGPDRL